MTQVPFTDPIAAVIASLDGIQARVALKGDRALLRQIVGADATQMLAGIPGSARSVLVGAQVEGRLSGFGRQHPGAVTLLLGEGGRTIGMLMLDWPSHGIVTLLDLTLLPGVRDQGRGTKVLSALCTVADQASRTLRASLFYDSPARRLLSRAGFTLTGDDATDIMLERRPGQAV